MTRDTTEQILDELVEAYGKEMVLNALEIMKKEANVRRGAVNDETGS
ncbi:hypothetical protein H1164_13115 [Thermoactinomyces daqus]|uniref:IS256 family transposase n=1 Tax=Thermoactinomyces daqus TaxID=1329516 RepID=A0A7W1XBX6_9BACL|nr:hypothetical protein [Thermoactinomyces daqus]MBA4543828.1 hypothetical protein [Thermoactinomyces daqus]